LKEEPVCVAAAASTVTAGAVARFASRWIANVSGESGCEGELGVCAIPSGAVTLSTNKILMHKDETKALVEEELQGSSVDEGETSSRIQYSLKMFL
jgi:hypothetical protein